MTSTNDATAAFLARAAVDLQQQLQGLGALELLSVEPAGSAAITLVARIRVSGEAAELRGSGDSLITAYADLANAAPLAAAFHQIVGAR